MININLLPPELKLRRLAAKRNASLVSYCIVAVIIFAILGVIAKSLESTIKANLTTATSNVAQGMAQLDEDKDLQEMALAINDREKTTQEINLQKVFWSQVLQDLLNSVPQDVQFENFTANSAKTPNFILQGNTTTEREVIKFKEKLENSVFFQNVAFKSSSLTKDQNQEAEKLKFTLEFDLEQKSITGSVSGINQGFKKMKEIK
ncbi:MAG: PilN domain-containing protein [Patescibacteria group bacterium]